MSTTEVVAASPSTLELNAHLDSKITAVTLYPYRADITRSFRCELKPGLTEVRIPTGFPSSFDRENLRIEVNGDATLADVKKIWEESGISTDYSKIDALYEKQSLLEQSLERCTKMTTAIDSYAQVALDKASGMSPLELGRFLDLYDECGAKWNAKMKSLEKEIQETKDKIDDEESNYTLDSGYSRSGVTFMLSTEEPKAVTVNVTYGTAGASWYAAYDIFAASNGDQAVTLVYKAFVSNNTGESWDAVDLTLATVAPQTEPKLQQWRLYLQKPPSTDAWRTHTAYLPPKTLTDTRLTLPGRTVVPDKTGSQPLVLAHHKLKARLSWICTPRMSSDVYIKAKATNSSNYALREGSWNVYLDGNFIASRYMDSVNPGEDFDLSIGVDPKIHVTYHPRDKEIVASEPPSRFAFKPMITYSCSQRITVLNSGDTTVPSLIVVDSIPSADDLDISVRLIHPPLQYPDSTTPGFKDLGLAKTGIRVTEGVPEPCSVYARWDMVDEPVHDLQLLGTNGKMNWVCTIPGKESVELSLRWQVLVYSSQQIKGF